MARCPPAAAATTCPAGRPPPPREEEHSQLLPISFQGFRWDYDQDVDTPNRDRLAGEGVKAKYLMPPLVTMTSPSHFTAMPEHGSLLLKSPRTGVIMTLTVTREEEWRLFLTEWGQEIRPALAKRWPRVWAEDNPPGFAVNQAPVLIEVKPRAQPVSKNRSRSPEKLLKVSRSISST
ncbi:uncharacterized protein LOC134810661 isoform X1 [Pan troglodytes]|uniref:uncharacterized protein LOC134810661 isoform X1 n=1 Tax=Pan troglodytes TaxID=9598 RepID=UPI00301362E9